MLATSLLRLGRASETIRLHPPESFGSSRFYTGLTSDVGARLIAHNAGRCVHTASGRPWKVIIAIEFANERRAVEFERYLKSGSGVAFSMRHFR
jgi:hypothetical protein